MWTDQLFNLAFVSVAGKEDDCSGLWQQVRMYWNSSWTETVHERMPIGFVGWVQNKLPQLQLKTFSSLLVKSVAMVTSFKLKSCWQCVPTSCSCDRCYGYSLAKAVATFWSAAELVFNAISEYLKEKLPGTQVDLGHTNLILCCTCWLWPRRGLVSQKKKQK